MKMLNFAKRNFKEFIRDPLGLTFEIILPIFLLIIFKQFNIPGDTYKLENFTPSIIIFGLSFITLFTSTLVSKDRTSSFLIRLGVSPMKPSDFILGYIISLIPIVIIQNILFFLVGTTLGLNFNINYLYTIVISIIISIMFITLGILIGSLVSEKATGGVGSIIVQLVCFTSGMYFPKELVGKTFSKICSLLPFESSVDIVKSVFNGKSINVNNILIILIYMILIIVISIIVFKKNMISDNK